VARSSGVEDADAPVEKENLLRFTMQPQTDVDKPIWRLFGFGTSLAPITDDAALDLRRVLLANRSEAHVTFPVRPGIPVPWVYLRGRLKFLITTTNAAFHERHDPPPYRYLTGGRGAAMKDEASYNCDSCGEEIVVPIDLSAGKSQEYVEDCPVCCCPNVIHVEIEDGEVRVWAERE
jgi:hypothetical protein